ncbi:hypothetical protein CIHG_04257 [Coccidioides immitis H538.4]|uniref:Uncharacterized protein n=1 Tax=Coccidioides immitis H538.4 TaxID=396776 RepID=A0A0J8RR66_COCIT|nr:hypothetical protein CIHG_04257 [Coccidioides immitis H538.4]
MSGGSATAEGEPEGRAVRLKLRADMYGGWGWMYGWGAFWNNKKHGSRKGVATSRREPSERQQTREWLRLTLSKHKDEADVRWPVIGWDALARCRIGFKAASEPPCTCRAAIS